MAARLLPSVSIFRSRAMELAVECARITGAIDPALARFAGDAIASVRPDVLHLEGGGLAALLRSTARRASPQFSACMTRRRCATANSPSMPPRRAGADSS